MIRTEYFDTRSDGVRLFRTYSNSHRRIKQVDTNAIYDEAIDVENSGHTYLETDESTETLEPQEALNLIFGGAE